MHGVQGVSPFTVTRSSLEGFHLFIRMVKTSAHFFARSGLFNAI
jgi:hypothetical protein